MWVLAGFREEMPDDTGRLQFNPGGYVKRSGPLGNRLAVALKTEHTLNVQLR